MKKISILVIALIAVFSIIKASQAYFSSQAQSLGNAFNSIPMTILLSDDNEGRKNPIFNSWFANNVIPGTVIPEKIITIRNNSDVNADHLDIKFSYTGSEDLAKNIVLTDQNAGFRFGSTTADSGSINLNTLLKGGTDVDYIVTNGSNGQPVGNNVDGADGTTKDNKLSLSELSAYGKIRITPSGRSDGIAGGTEAKLWLNAKVDEKLVDQLGQIDATITFTLDQNGSQF